MFITVQWNIILPQKRNATLAHAATWMNLRNVVLIKIRRKMTKYCMIPIYEWFRVRKVIDLGVNCGCRGLEQVRMGCYCFKRHSISAGVTEEY